MRFRAKLNASSPGVVHSTEAGQLIVVATLLRATAKAKDNKALDFALRSVPAAEGNVVAGVGLVQPDHLLPPPPRRSAYYAYEGSLTTPPCSESVSWIVMDAPAAVSAAQVLDFQRILGERRTLELNARPLQPANGRIVRHVG